MGKRGRYFLAFVLSYLLASIACWVSLQWPDFKGHVHVPFSSFPESLVWAPFSPLAAAIGFAYQPVKALLALSIFLSVFALVFFMSTRRSAS